MATTIISALDAFNFSTSNPSFIAEHQREELRIRCNAAIREAATHGRKWALVHGDDFNQETIVKPVWKELNEAGYRVSMRPDEEGYMQLYLRWGHFERGNH